MTTQNDLGRELAKREDGDSGRVDRNGIIQETFRREQQRVRFWAGITIASWVLAAGSCLLSIYFFMVFFYPRLAQYLLHGGEDGKGIDPAFPGILAKFLLYSNIIWPLLLLVAAGCTTLFILKSRGATLRQIRVSLAEISRAVERHGDKK